MQIYTIKIKKKKKKTVVIEDEEGKKSRILTLLAAAQRIFAHNILLLYRQHGKHFNHSVRL